VIDVSEHFLVHEKTPTLLLVLRYREIPDSGGGGARQHSSGTRQSPEAARKDWRAELDAQGQRTYDEFRLWRGRKAKHEGLPPYLILNNRELAELVMKHPANITQLREIEGIGEAKAKRKWTLSGIIPRTAGTEWGRNFRANWNGAASSS